MREAVYRQGERREGQPAGVGRSPRLRAGRRHAGHLEARSARPLDPRADRVGGRPVRSEEHTSELQSLMRISYAVFCLKKKKKQSTEQNDNTDTSNNEREQLQVSKHK